MFEAFFPHRNIDGKAEYKIFEYENLIKAAKKFPKFGSEGTLAMRKREVSHNLEIIYFYKTLVFDFLTSYLSNLPDVSALTQGV